VYGVTQRLLTPGVPRAVACVSGGPHAGYVPRASRLRGTHRCGTSGTTGSRWSRGWSGRRQAAGRLPSTPTNWTGARMIARARERGRP